MYQIILVIHIIGALGLLGVIITALLAVIDNKISYLKNLAKAIGIGFVFQTLTGSMLVLNSQSNATYWSFCSKMSLYLIVVAITEIILFYKIKKTQKFPTKAVLSTSLISVTLSFLTLMFSF